MYRFAVVFFFPRRVDSFPEQGGNFQYKKLWYVSVGLFPELRIPFQASRPSFHVGNLSVEPGINFWRPIFLYRTRRPFSFSDLGTFSPFFFSLSLGEVRSLPSALSSIFITGIPAFGGRGTTLAAPEAEGPFMSDHSCGPPKFPSKAPLAASKEHSSESTLAARDDLGGRVLSEDKQKVG